MLRPDFPLETARLLLRPFTENDFDALYDLQSRPEVTRYLLFDTRDQGQVRQALQDRIRSAALEAEGDNLGLAVVLRATGEVIGEVVLFWRSREHRQGEIGYIFHPGHGGKGYATEASEEMLRLGFEELGLHRIVGRLNARNTASARVLQRLGMRREAELIHSQLLKGEWADEVVYAMLEDEWRAREL
ncbi:GNAT family N-acetyltransferase [Nonomuraea sp. NPDC050404]|uniref:GNAT family N-acetyltransferase n=1 Tax=Nonomuraea sp. NPDC050404 TaxID=3155783 RepID=UPI00340B374B